VRDPEEEEEEKKKGIPVIKAGIGQGTDKRPEENYN
jgi:hypothetical protein